MGKKAKLTARTVKSGFSLIEVMLVLGISGLMLVGLLAGTFSSISSQRYTDAVRSFAEYLRSVYNEVISPESLGYGNSNTAVLGKIVTFSPDNQNEHGEPVVYSATIVGKANANYNSGGTSNGIAGELASPSVEAQLYCGESGGVISDEHANSTVEYFIPLWQTRFLQPNDPSLGMTYGPDNTFTGTFIIARAPSSGTVQTAYNKDLFYNLKDHCRPEDNSASNKLKQDLVDYADQFMQSNSVDICIKSDDVRSVRAVQIIAGGRNTSAVSVLNADDEGNKCR